MHNKKNIAFVFPGQGSQFAGMGLQIYKNFQEARLVFEEVDEALQFNLSKTIFEGTEEELRKTENTQPALMATSIAVLRVLEKQSGKKAQDIAKVMAGHSLGEYSALCASSAISLKDTAIILRKRGQLMASCMPFGGGMLAIIGLPEEKVEEVIEKAKQNQVLVIANDNAVGQIVLSGEAEAIERAYIISKELGARMAVKLEVSGPFHSPLLNKASEGMEKELLDINFSLPLVPIINNVTVKEYKTIEEIKEILAKQVISRVRFREAILKMQHDGVKIALELGARKVLCGLFKRTAKEIECFNVETQEEIEKILPLI